MKTSLALCVIAVSALVLTFLVISRVTESQSIFKQRAEPGIVFAAVKSLSHQLQGMDKNEPTAIANESADTLGGAG